MSLYNVTPAFRSRLKQRVYIAQYLPSPSMNDMELTIGCVFVIFNYSFAV